MYKQLSGVYKLSRIGGKYLTMIAKPRQRKLLIIAELTSALYGEE